MTSISMIARTIALISVVLPTITNIVMAAEQLKNQSVLDPAKIKFTHRMSQSEKNFAWSDTYYKSFKKTKEPRYLGLAANHCLKAISMLHDTQMLLSRTTRFYNQADKKRLRACEFYKLLQQKSFLLPRFYHLKSSGIQCQKELRYRYKEQNQ